MQRTFRKFLFTLLGIVILSALIWRFHNSVSIEGFRWSLLAASLHHARLSLLALSLATIFLCYALRALRWQRFSRWLGSSRFLSVYDATLIGFTCVFLLGRAGEPVRPVLIARKENFPVSSMFGVYVLERVLDAAATAVFTGLALVFASRRSFSVEENSPLLAAARTTGALLLAGLLAIVALLIYFRAHGAGALARRLERMRARGGSGTKLALLFTEFGEGLQGIRTGGDLAAAIAYTAAHWFLVALIYLWVPWSLGGKLAALNFPAAMLVLAFTMVGSTLQLPGVGGGSQVASFLVFTVVFGVEKEPAAAAAILIWLITFTGVSLAGLPLLFREGWSMGELRRLARVEATGKMTESRVPPEGIPAKSERDLR